MECGTKRRFATREAAEVVQKQLVWTNHVRGQDARSVGLNTYPCSQCEYWHIGHLPSVPLVYHYTSAKKLDAIIDSGCLKPAKPKLLTRKERRELFHARLTPHDRKHMQRIMEEPVPLLWFSRNQEWEYSAGGERGRAKAEIAGEGLVRFGVSAFVAKLRWSDYIQRNQIPPDFRDWPSRYGDPREWLATDEAVQLPDGVPRWNEVRTVEVYCAERWQPIETAADTFEDYMANRPAVYAVGRQAITDKVNAAIDRLPPGETGVDIRTVLDFDSLPEPERILWTDFVRYRYLKRTEDD